MNSGWWRVFGVHGVLIFMSALFQTAGSMVSPRLTNRGRWDGGIALKSSHSVGSAAFNGASRSFMLPQKFHEVLFQGVRFKVFVHNSVLLEYLGDGFDWR
jgi:hypothetical protein